MIDLIDIAPDFSFIIEKGFISSTNFYNPKEFGNANLVMQGKNFSLRFERDRSQIFVDIGNDKAGWYKLEYVLEFVNNSITDERLGEPPNINFLAKLLYEQWENIYFLFSSQQKKLHLQEFVKQKSSNLVGKIFGNS